MAIAFDSSGQQLNSGSTSNSFSFTNTAGNLLIVGCVDDANSTISVTYNGVAMTSIGSVQDPATFFKVELFYLLSPATGSNTLTATRTTGTGGFAVHGVSYSGAKPDSQVDSFNTGSNNSTSLTINTTVVNSNCWLVGIWAVNSSPQSAGTGATARGSVTGPSGEIGQVRMYDSNGIVATGSQGMTVTMSLGNNAGIVASIRPPFSYSLSMAQGSYTLTGNKMGFGFRLIMSAGSYLLTGISATFTLLRKWVMPDQNTSSWSEQNQNTSTMNLQSKNSSSWTNQNQN